MLNKLIIAVGVGGVVVGSLVTIGVQKLIKVLHNKKRVIEHIDEPVVKPIVADRPKIVIDLMQEVPSPKEVVVDDINGELLKTVINC